MSGETESVYGLRVLRVVTGTTGRHLRRDLGATAWGVSFEQGFCRQSEVPRCLGDSSSAATYLDVSFSEDLLQTI